MGGYITNKNKDSMNTLRNDILIILSDQNQTIDEAAEKILALFNVVGRSEQLVCSCCNKKTNSPFRESNSGNILCFDCAN